MPIPTIAQSTAQGIAGREIEDVWTEDAPRPIRYSPLGVEMVETEGPLRLDSLIPQDAAGAQTDARAKRRDMDATFAEPPQQQGAKGQGKNRYMIDRWRGS